MRKLWLMVLTTSCLVIGVGTAALAAPPTIQRAAEATVDSAFPAGTVCVFPVDVHQEMKVKFITFVDAGGNPIRSISTGKIHHWERTSGPARPERRHLWTELLRDRALVRGTGGWSGVQLQDSTWVRTRGMITFDANQLIQTVRGHVESLCGTLA